MKKEHKKHELDDIFNKYSKSEISCIGSVNELKIARVIDNLEDFEEPDMYSIVDDTLYIIEHFEFDSYKNNKKGSVYKREVDLNYQLLQQVSKGGNGSITGDIESDSSFKYYVDNFIKHFNYHYSRIETYKNNLLKIYPNITKFKIWFFAEDSDSIMPMINNTNTCCCVHPLNFQRAKDNLKDKNLIDGIVIGACFGNCKNQLLFIKKEHFYDSVIFSESEDIYCTKGHYVLFQSKL